MRTARAYRFFGLVALTALGGCVALSGLGDLEVGDLADGGGVGPDGSHPLGTDGQTGNDVEPPRDSGFDFDTGHVPTDGGVKADANQPDTGGPDSGPAGPGVVACSATLDCSGQTPVCCYSPIYPVPACSATAAACPTEMGFACDDNSDCAKVCCVTWSGITLSGSSTCMDSCPTLTGGGGMGRQGIACSSAAQCGLNETCDKVSTAPAPIKACQ